MMFLKGKYCQLRSIEEVDLSLLLEWRNKEHVLQYMEYQKHISWEEHLQWYRNISEQGYHYFIIETTEKIPVGTIYISGKTLDNGAESGLYIGNEQFIGTGITIEASKIIIQYAFEHENLNYLYAKVKASNATIIAYNKMLGFKTTSKENMAFIKMVLMKDSKK